MRAPVNKRDARSGDKVANGTRDHELVGARQTRYAARDVNGNAANRGPDSLDLASVDPGPQTHSQIRR